MTLDCRKDETLSKSLQDLDSPWWKRLDYGVGFAIGWLIFAVVASVGLGPQLGLRGWAWLGLHHVICLIGCTHELRRGWRRRRGKLSVGSTD